MSRKEKIIRIVVGVALLCIAILLVGFLVWFLWLSKPKPDSDAEKVPETTADQNSFSNGAQQNSLQMERFVSSMSNNLVRFSGELSGLVSSNQTVMSGMLQALSAEMATNNAAIRSEIPEIVEKEVAKAMEPFQRFLTNPPPMQTVVTQFATCPPLVAAKTSPAPPVAVVTPTAVTNSNLLVVNLPPPPVPPQPQPVVTATPPPVVFENHNTMVVVGGNATASTNTAPPYWMRKLW